MENIINLYWMYPDMLNLHGDRANIMALGRVAAKLGCSLNITKIISTEENINFEKADILFFNPGELKVVKEITKRLKKDIKQIEEFVASEKYIIAIGTSGSLFANEIVLENGEEITGLGIFDMKCKERKTVIGDDIYFAIEDKQEIIGSQIHMLDFEVDEKQALGTVKYGYGNNGKNLEGARVKNLIFTNTLGPVMVKNPWWAETILIEIAKRKEIETNEIPIEEYEIEVKSFNSTKKFIESKNKIEYRGDNNE